MWKNTCYIRNSIGISSPVCHGKHHHIHVNEVYRIFFLCCWHLRRCVMRTRFFFSDNNSISNPIKVLNVRDIYIAQHDAISNVWTYEVSPFLSLISSVVNLSNMGWLDNVESTSAENIKSSRKKTLNENIHQKKVNMNTSRIHLIFRYSLFLDEQPERCFWQCFYVLRFIEFGDDIA